MRSAPLHAAGLMGLEDQFEQPDHHDQADNENDTGGTAYEFQHADAPFLGVHEL
jgi:hypothetical protein